jgi:hypothetical protein
MDRSFACFRPLRATKDSAQDGKLFVGPICEQKQKPTGRLLGACSGRRPMGYRFSLLTLLFSGVVELIKPHSDTKFRVFL